MIQRILPQLGLALVTLGLALYLQSRQSAVFTPDTLAYLFKYYSPLAMLALGMTFVVLTGGIDLSVGFGMMLFMFATAGLVRDHPGLSPWLAILAGFGSALLFGAIQGVSIAYLRIPAFIVSLAGMVAAYGLTLILSQNQSVSELPAPVLWLGGTTIPFLGADFPAMALVVVASYLAASLVLNRSAFGRRLYAIGSNREAARLSGVEVRRTELAAYLISAACAWAAGWMQMGINRTADPKVALSDSLELNAIAIVVIGGTSLSGGRGAISGTALGWLLLSLIFYGLPLAGYNDPSTKKLIQAGIIFLGAVLDRVQRRAG